MGRGGRSGGGGRSSGGGGSRSSGGRSSGSHRSGYSGSSRSRSGGGSSFRPFGGSHYGGHRRTFYGHSNYGGRPYHSGCSTLIAALAVILIAGVIIMSALVNSASGITKSTIQREALPKGSVIETDYYTDELGWIASSTKLTTGMKSFYNSTGVQPYLFITDTVNGARYPTDSDMDAYASELYDKLIKDEAHLLVLFWENNDSYKTWYVAGKQAKTVIDTEAADILLDYIDRYYYSDLNEDEFFSKAFNDAGKRIMTVTASPWIPVVFVVAAFGIILVLSRWWKNIKKQKNLEAEQTARILNTPLDMIGSGDTGLEDKYEK